MQSQPDKFLHLHISIIIIVIKKQAQGINTVHENVEGGSLKQGVSQCFFFFIYS